MRSRYRCSMCPAIHINSRSWLRSSSTHEPSDPPLRVIICVNFSTTARRVAPPRSSNESRTGIDRGTDAAGTATAPVRELHGYVRVVKVERSVDDDGWAIATAIR